MKKELKFIEVTCDVCGKQLVKGEVPKLGSSKLGEGHDYVISGIELQVYGGSTEKIIDVCKDCNFAIVDRIYELRRK